MNYTQNAIGLSNWSGDAHYNGALADVAVYKTVLSATQINNHYLAASTTTNATTDTYYPATGTPLVSGCASVASNQGGLLQAATSPAGSGGPTIIHQYVYDAQGRTVGTRISTDSTWSCTTYDARGRATQSTNSAGGSDNYNYTTPGTVVETYTDSGGTPRTVTTAVDLLGRTTSYTDPFGTVTDTYYDQAGRVTSTTRQLPGQSGFTTVMSETYAASGANADRLVSETENVSTTPQTISYGYDAYGRQNSVTRPAGIASTTMSFDPNLGYENNITHTAGTTTLAYAYVGSPAGKNQSETVTGAASRTRSFTYDNAGRLTQTVQTGGTAPGTRSYSYDADSNRCSTTAACNGSYTYDTADRLVTSPYATGYTYNSHGAVTAETAAAGQQAAKSIGYDGWDHTTSVDDGTNTTTNTTDPLGRVLRQVVTNDTSQVVTSDTTNGYDDSSDSPAWTQPTVGGNLTAYIDTSGGLIIDTAGTPAYQLGDRQGSIAATSTTTAPLTVAAETDEFGKTVTGAQATLGWLGEKERFSQDPALGIIHMGERLYDTNLGRFLETDPVPGGSANNYDYSNQDPINQLDLDGTWPNWRQLIDYLGGDFCDALKQQINGLAREIQARIHEAKVNKHHFRLNDRNDLNHYNQFKQKQRALQNKVNTYLHKCGCDLGRNVAQALRASFPAPGGGNRPQAPPGRRP